jgi:hypothetical protein
MAGVPLDASDRATLRELTSRTPGDVLAVVALLEKAREAGYRDGRRDALTDAPRVTEEFQRDLANWLAGNGPEPSPEGGEQP